MAAENRSFSGAWRLPCILVRLLADHVLLFWLNRPATEVAVDFCRRLSRAEFHSPDESELHSAADLYRLSSHVLRYGFLTSRPCLRRSLLLLRWCCKRRIQAHMVIGVDRTGESLEGHSWIELEGRPFMESSAFLLRYTPMLKICSRSGLQISAQNTE